MMRTANPAFTTNVFTKTIGTNNSGKTMTIGGTVNKIFILLLLMLVTAVYTWGLFFKGKDVSVFMYVGIFGGLALMLLTIFKKQWAPFTTPIYALLEGLFIGGLSSYFELQFSGIVIQAVALTLATLLVILIIYRLRIIKVTQNFRMGIVAATGAVALIYLATVTLGFFNIQIPYIHETGWIGIAFSLIVVTLAALNLVLDFDFIEQGTQVGAPKYMEWYAAFGLLITLIWLYIELLRLLSKFRRR